MRDYNYELMSWIEARWSPRAISPEPVAVEDVRAVVDAARQAPSCFNEQPWRFMVAQEPEALETFRGLLTDKNKRWAGKAPVLMLLLAAKTFQANGKANRWNQFDTGTAWGFLSLEAVRRGLVTHAMAGFDRVKAAEVLQIPETYDIIAMVALGRYGDPADLDEDFRQTEHPAGRKPLDEVLLTPAAFMKAPE